MPGHEQRRCWGRARNSAWLGHSEPGDWENLRSVRYVGGRVHLASKAMLRTLRTGKLRLLVFSSNNSPIIISIYLELDWVDFCFLKINNPGLEQL